MKNTEPFFRNTLALFIAALVLPLLTGCAGYQLGSMLPGDVNNVYVPTFVNKTEQLDVEVETTQATLEELQLDGSLRVVDEDDADAILLVTVFKYDLTPISYDRGRQRTLANEFRLTLTASVILKRRITDEIVVEDPVVKGDTTIELVGDLTSAKREALPRASTALAKEIVARIVEYW